MSYIFLADVIEKWGSDERCIIIAGFAGIVAAMISFMTTSQRKVGTGFLVIILCALSVWSVYDSIKSLRAKKRADYYAEIDAKRKKMKADKEDRTRDSALVASREKLAQLAVVMENRIDNLRVFSIFKDQKIEDVSFEVTIENIRNFIGSESRFWGNTFANHPYANAVMTFAAFEKMEDFQYRRTVGSYTYFQHLASFEQSDTTSYYFTQFDQDLFRREKGIARFGYKLHLRADSSVVPVNAGEFYEHLQNAPFVFQITMLDLHCSEREKDAVEKIVRKNFAHIRIAITPRNAFGLKFYVPLKLDAEQSYPEEDGFVLTWKMDGDPLSESKWERREKGYMARR